jgi:hypothetical protein
MGRRFPPVLRAGFVVVLGALLGGCWWQASAVPAVEAGDRPSRPLLRDGIYCTVLPERGALTIPDDCAQFAWDASSRRIRGVEVYLDGEERGGAFWLDAIQLPGDLALLQQDGDDDEDYELFALVIRRDGYAAIPLPPPDVQYTLAAEEGVSLDPETFGDDYGYITAGEPAALRRLVARAAEAWLASEAPAGIDKFAPHDPDAVENGRYGPLYAVRMESLDANADEAVALAAVVARLRRELERAAERRGGGP